MAFWVGVTGITAGVLVQLPPYFAEADMDYRMAGMAMGADMWGGMALVLVGLLVAAYGLLPARSFERAPVTVRATTLDDASMTRRHVALILVLAAAVTIDVMKPVTLSFVVPGVAAEYDLRSPLNPDGSLPVALLPLAGIIGTVLGSFAWGGLADRIGRRASILLAGLFFAGTSVCAVMPSFAWNLVMCFVMGIGVGGMLPIAFALLAETVPARHRGWVMVLIGGDVAGAYLLTSWLSTELTPEFGWRILWLVGLPTALLLILLNRWIPESPRFLIAHGRTEEARRLLDSYGAELVPVARPATSASGGPPTGWGSLAARPLRGLTGAVAVLGIGVGLVTFGFQLWIPTNLNALGLDEVTAARVLRDSALIGFPATFLVAWAYGAWSSKWTLGGLALLTAASLVGFVAVGDSVVGNRPLLYVLLIMPITGISSLLAVLIAYSAEVYPTLVRARGTGLVAGASKGGGVLVIALVVVAIAPPSIAGTALLGAVPLMLGAVGVFVFGIETRGRPLEELEARATTTGAAQVGVPS